MLKHMAAVPEMPHALPAEIVLPANIAVRKVVAVAYVQVILPL